MVNKRESAAKAERAFKLFDKDNDGYITKVEFQKISEKLDKSQVQNGICCIVITFSIFCLCQSPIKDFYLQMHNATNSNISTQIQIDAIYKKFDKDNDGVLSLAEFKKMMNRENPD